MDEFYLQISVPFIDFKLVNIQPNNYTCISCLHKMFPSFKEPQLDVDSLSHNKNFKQQAFDTLHQYCEIAANLSLLSCHTAVMYPGIFLGGGLQIQLRTETEGR
jgi:hypothetical protein